MILLEVNNQTRFRVPQKRILKVLQLAQEKLRLKKTHSLSFAYVSPARIKKLNGQYRKKNKVTDVLSFAEDGRAIGVEGFLGEIIICPVRAQKQAKEFKQSFEREILKLTLHGYLHILGYDHETDEEAREMERWESKILEAYV
jgi:probable rRNA maturation factor